MGLGRGGRNIFFKSGRPGTRTKPACITASPPRNELRVLQAQIRSAADSFILTSPYLTPGHPEHALLSGYVWKRNRKVWLSLPMWPRNGLHNCIYFGGSFWDTSARAGLCVSSQFSLPLFLLQASGSLLPVQEPGTPAPGRPHSAPWLLTLRFPRGAGQGVKPCASSTAFSQSNRWVHFFSCFFLHLMTRSHEGSTLLVFLVCY